MLKKNFLLSAFFIFLLLCPAILATAQLIADQEYQLLYNSLGKVFTIDQKLWFDAQHENYIQENPVAPLVRSEQFTFGDSGIIPELSRVSSISRVLMLINQNLYSNQEAKLKIDRYIQDVSNGHGCVVEAEVFQGGSAEQIKDIIKQYYNNGGLDGVVQIGSFQPAWYYDPNPEYGGDFTCDLFFMDLDGTWRDNDRNGIYDSHDNGSGDRGPEIFYGRIDPATMGAFGSEVELLSAYLDKNHAYWMKEIPLIPSAYVQIEPDWRTAPNYVERIYGGANTEVVRGTGSRSDYLNNRLSKNYSFLHLWCHSGDWAHFFDNGGELRYTSIVAAQPKPIGYAHDGCHCADWAAGRGRGFTVGAYVFNQSQTSLVAISGTKTGQWIGYQGAGFFEQLASNQCIGKAYQIWFSDYIRNARDMKQVLEWDYGYCIIGDPMITFIEVPAAIPTPTPSPAPTETPVPSPVITSTPMVLLGDVNGDAFINIVDALLIAQEYVGFDPEAFNELAGDVDCDGSITIVDALLIAQYYVGLINRFC